MIIRRVLVCLLGLLIVFILFLVLWYSKNHLLPSTKGYSKQMIATLDSLARVAITSGDIPVSAVLLYGDSIIGSGYNTVLRDGNAGGHAEINAISVGIRRYGLDGFMKLNRDSFVVITTLEPCPMCEGAIAGYGIRNVEFLKPKPIIYLIKEDLRGLRYQWELQQRGPANLQDSLFHLHPDYNP